MIARVSSGIRSVADLRGKRLGVVHHVGQGPRSPLRPAIQSVSDRPRHRQPDHARCEIRALRARRTPIPPRFAPGTVESRPRSPPATTSPSGSSANEFDAIAVDSASDVAHHASIRVLYDTLQHPDFLARAHPDTPARAGRERPSAARPQRRRRARARPACSRPPTGPRPTPATPPPSWAAPSTSAPDSLTGKYENLSDGLQISLGIEKILSLKAQKNFLLQHGLLTKDFDTHSWIRSPPPRRSPPALHTEWKASGRGQVTRRPFPPTSEAWHVSAYLSSRVACVPRARMPRRLDALADGHHRDLRAVRRASHLRHRFFLRPHRSPSMRARRRFSSWESSRP